MDHIFKKTDLILSKIPLVKVFYNTIKQILETILKSNSNAFREAVLMEYPRKGVWVIGFTTGQVKGVIKDKIKTKWLMFLSQLHNPTSGFLLLVPKNQLKYLNTNVDDTIKTIVSAGINSFGR